MLQPVKPVRTRRRTMHKEIIKRKRNFRNGIWKSIYPKMFAQCAGIVFNVCMSTHLAFCLHTIHHNKTDYSYNRIIIFNHWLCVEDDASTTTLREFRNNSCDIIHALLYECPEIRIPSIISSLEWGFCQTILSSCSKTMKMPYLLTTYRK